MGLYKLVVFVKNAKVGQKFNTIPDPDLFIKDPDARQWEIMEVTDEPFSAVAENDCLYVWCRKLRN